MNVVKNLVSPSQYSVKCPYMMAPQFIVVHNTANDASARNEVAYMVSNDREVSFHYAVDDKQVVRGIPENRNAWHAGDGGNGKGNRYGIAVEICYSKSGGERFIKAEKLAAEFIAERLKAYCWGIGKVKKHQDFSGKYCPHRTLDMGWQRFLNMVHDELNKLKGADNMANKIEDKNIPSTWAKDAWKWTKTEGYMDGERPHDRVTREELAVILYRLKGVK